MQCAIAYIHLHLSHRRGQINFIPYNQFKSILVTNESESESESDSSEFEIDQWNKEKRIKNSSI